MTDTGYPLGKPGPENNGQLWHGSVDFIVYIIA